MFLLASHFLEFKDLRKTQRSKYLENKAFVISMLSID